MKQRSGFVSNSSSSSFIIGFVNDPTSKEALAQEMQDCSPTGWYADDNVMTNEEIIDRVWNDLIDAGPATDAQVYKELSYYVPYNAVGKPEFKDFSNDKEGWAAYDRARNAFNEAYIAQHPEITKFLKDLKSKHVYIVSYADDEGEGVLEHGDIFRNIESVIAVSHH